LPLFCRHRATLPDNNILFAETIPDSNCPTQGTNSPSLLRESNNCKEKRNSMIRNGRYNVVRFFGRCVVSQQSNQQEPLSKATASAKAFIDIQNSGIFNKLPTITSPQCVFQFHEVELLVDTAVEELSNTRSSFPDFHLCYEKIIDISPTQAKIVNLQASGTHTGTPYGFGPYPEISATGIRCKNDFEDVTITVDAQTGMILSTKFVAKGPLTGPAGLYNQIGGMF
jgi:hypothetical protein